MTPAEFKRKWAKYSGKETSAYQEHFNDLCALLGQPSPVTADPTGSESFCFQKRVLKDAELFAFDDGGRVAEEADQERGFADVWKRDCFAWEYKGKKKNLDEAYRQLLRYRESLLNPPLLVVCDFDRYIVRTNFNGTVQETKEFTNAQIDEPWVLSLLRAVFADPEFLKPQRRTDEVTQQLARQIAEVARSLQERESVELIDAKSRREHSVAQRKNLRIARFLNRIVFCFFAEDTGLLPKKGVVTDIFKTGGDDPAHFAATLEELFRTMATGGNFGAHKIRHFNGHLFEEATVFELTEEEIGKLATAGEADWQFIQPSIMGNLFERGLDPDQRAQLGAHYTSEEDIITLVEPVLMAPLRREWSKLKADLARAFVSGKGSTTDRTKLSAFHEKITSISVLDPACGSGNFLYVSLQLLLDLEKELITFATQLAFKFEPRISVQQLKAIELNAYAFELAQVAVQIGYLKWRRDNGFANERDPVLQNLDNFLNDDALLVPHFRSKAKSLKEAQAGEHASDDALKFYTEREWPAADVIVGNPPFLGDKRMRGELGHHYVESLRETFSDRIPGGSDLCCYWFEKAREQIVSRKCKRAGLLATNSIRQPGNRKVLERILATANIFFAESDRPWVLDGAAVRVSMAGFDEGSEKTKTLDGKSVDVIDATLSSSSASATSHRLVANKAVSFVGDCKKGAFDISDDLARELLRTAGNPNGKPNSDVIVPLANADDITDRFRNVWIIDFGISMPEAEAALFEKPFAYVKENVKPARDKVRSNLERKRWWLHARPASDMRKAIEGTARYIATPGVSKHRLFVWLRHPILPAHRLVVFGVKNDFQFGLLQSRFHSVWALRLGSTLEDRPCYTPTTCFETFPFPQATAEHEKAIATAAKELNELRENWLNPPEWTQTGVLEFPGSVDGPWSRFVQEPDGRGVGTVRYPRLEPRDEECAAKLKKRTLTNLYNERPAWLAHAHAKLDAAVAAAYGWPADLSDEEILEHLLALNLERAAEEKRTAKATSGKRSSRTKTADEMI